MNEFITVPALSITLAPGTVKNIFYCFDTCELKEKRLVGLCDLAGESVLVTHKPSVMRILTHDKGKVDCPTCLEYLHS